MSDEPQKPCAAVTLPGAREALTATIKFGADLETLAAVIARSPIIVAAPKRRLPAGYDAVDLAILDWIMDESRAHAGRRALPM